MDNIPTLQGKRKIDDDLKRQVIWNYIYKRLGNRRLKGCEIKDKRGVEMNYSEISRNTKLTYKQVRGLVDRLVKSDIIEKWSTYSTQNCRHNYYRLKD